MEQDNNVKSTTLLVQRNPRGEVRVLAGGPYGHADGTRGQARFANIVGIALGRDGSIYVSDDPTLRKVSPEGKVTTLAEHLDTFDAGTIASKEALSWGTLMGVAASGPGEVYVADFRNRRVLEVSRDGKIATVLTAEPPWSPTGVAIGPSGDLFVLEVVFRPPGTWLKPRVRKRSSDGGLSIVAVVPP